MEAFYTILGLAMFYLWIHAVVIVAKKVSNLTGYEKFVLIAGIAFAGLYLLGTL